MALGSWLKAWSVFHYFVSVFGNTSLFTWFDLMYYRKNKKRWRQKLKPISSIYPIRDDYGTPIQGGSAI